MLSGEAGHVTYEVRVPGMLVSDTTINGSTYRQLRFPGEGVLGYESLPELPAVSRITGHAPDAQVSIQAQYLDSVILGGYLVFPAQPVWTWTYPPALPPAFAINSAFYQTNASYPQAREYLDTLGIWRDLGVHVTALVPFRYNPAAGELVAYTRIVMTVTFQGGASLPPAVARSRHQSYQPVVANFDCLGIGIDESGLKDRFIIVLGDNSPELRDAIEPLRVWKTLRGLEVYTPAVGVDFPAEQYQIRDYLAQHYSPLWETAVLLVGDNNTIPAPDDWGVRNSNLPDSVVPPRFPTKMGSNTWYALVAHTPADTWPTENILVGRLASTDPDIVEGYVKKVMRYERYIDVGWVKRDILFVIDARNPPRGARVYKETLLRNLRGILPGGITVQVADGGVHDYRRVFECLEAGGGVGTVNFLGHGDIRYLSWRPDGGEYWSIAEAGALRNRARTPVVYSMSCGNGFIRDRYGPLEGLAEAWTENPHGGAIGVAAVSAMGMGFPTIWQDGCLSENPYYNLPPSRDRLWVGENFMEGKLWARMQNIQPRNKWQNQYAYLALHWLGDPTVNAWSCDRGPLQLEFSPGFMMRNTPTTIQAVVRDAQGAPVSRAWVGLYKEGVTEPELLCSGPTDQAGDVVFRHITVPTAGTILVSAFKDWYRVAEGHITVGPPEGDGGSQEDDYESGALVPKDLTLSALPLQARGIRVAALAPRPAALTMSVFDASGRALAPTRNVDLSPGSQVLDLSGLLGLTDVAPGVYFLRYCATVVR